MGNIGNVELDVSNGGYGGVLTVQPNGDWLLAQDTPGNPAATLQRVRRIMFYNARLVDANGTPISFSTDLFYPNDGSSIRALVGEPATATTLAAIKSRVLAGLATDPGLRQPFNIFVVPNGTDSVDIGGTVTTIEGQLVTLPTETVQVS